KLSKRLRNFKTLNLNKTLRSLMKNTFLGLWIIYPQRAVKVIHTPIYGGCGCKIHEIAIGGDGNPKKWLGKTFESLVKNFQILETARLIA
ncbi:MAG: hypothetical protein K8R77_03240, partial [Anaerolineaceae bacterium]|nr:hypothetical protein [Anaerolineaceae bacterium]